MSNFSEKLLAKQKKERGIKGNYRWLNESLFVAEFKVKGIKEDKTIYDFAKSRMFSVIIIRIIRGKTLINMPSSAKEKVKDGDILHMLGTKDDIEACMMLLEKEDSIEYTDRDDIVLKDYIYGQTFYGVSEEKQLICCPIKVDSESEFVKKSIKNSQMREKYKGSIIGIERDNLPIINPSVDLVIQQDDLMWVLGGKRMADLLIKNNVLNSDDR